MRILDVKVMKCVPYWSIRYVGTVSPGIIDNCIRIRIPAAGDQCLRFFHIIQPNNILFNAIYATINFEMPRIRCIFVVIYATNGDLHLSK
jgi:hypothetical protein